MHCTRNLIIFFLVLLFNFSYAQETVLHEKLSVHFNNTPLIEVLQYIETNSSALFYFRSDIIPHTKITCSYSEEKLEIILNALLENQGIRYIVRENKIYLQKKTTTQAIQKETFSVNPSLPKKGIPKTPSLTFQNHEIQGKPQASLLKKKPYIVTPYMGYAHSFSTIHIPHENTESEQITKIADSEKLIPSSATYGINIQFGIKYMSFITGFGKKSYSWDKKIEETYTQLTDSIIGYNETTSTEIIYTKKPNHPEQSEAKTTDTVTIITRTPEYYTKTEEFNYSNTNTAHYISIPLGFSFSQKIHKNVYSYIGLVSSIHLLHSSEGYAFNEVYTPTAFDNTLRDYFISFTPHISITYMYTPTYGFMVASSYSYSLTQTTKEAMPINRKLSQLHIIASFVYTLLL
ncbi:MAG: hypothetical protein ACOCWB_03160 [Bacteroidota bacterium]